MADLLAVVEASPASAFLIGATLACVKRYRTDEPPDAADNIGSLGTVFGRRIACRHRRRAG